MEIRTLQYFLAVAREQNMTGAANMLHITQPTLSRQMADLEKELGKQLFIRTNRSTLLTEEGIRLRQRAEEIVSLVQQTKAEISDDQPELTGCIRIGAGETPVMHFLPHHCARL
uniref:LysR family transcriptional regulator n=1 Tax=Megasphaera sp. TaxID=2023260 RepID=UPI0040262CEE